MTNNKAAPTIYTNPPLFITPCDQNHMTFGVHVYNILLPLAIKGIRGRRCFRAVWTTDAAMSKICRFVLNVDVRPLNSNPVSKVYVTSHITRGRVD